jgi:hypothetical protein
MLDSGHRCGYVGLPAGHPLHGVKYNESVPGLDKSALDGPVGKRGIIPLLLADTDNPALDVLIDVHGGLTYAGEGSKGYPAASRGLWWFGFDCGHYNDLPSPEWLAAAPPSMQRLHREMSSVDPTRVHRSLDYCVRECESLAQQLATICE